MLTAEYVMAFGYDRHCEKQDRLDGAPLVPCLFLESHPRGKWRFTARKIPFRSSINNLCYLAVVESLCHPGSDVGQGKKMNFITNLWNDEQGQDRSEERRVGEEC